MSATEHIPHTASQPPHTAGQPPHASGQRTHAANQAQHAATSPQFVTVTLNPAIDRTASVEGFTPGAVNRARHSADKAGGKGVNVAAALALYGVPTLATGLLGADNRQIFDTLFARLGITDAFTTLPGQTRLGIKIADSRNNTTTDINFPGLRPDAAALHQVAETTLKAVHRSGQTATEAAQRSDQTMLRSVHYGGQPAPWVALCGSLPPQTDCGLYAQWITRLKAQGARVLLDTSGEALRQGITAAPDLIKPNREELQELLGQPLDGALAIAQAAQTLIRRHGIGIVAVSMGAQGVCLVSEQAAVHAHSAPIEVYSSVGAGDAMVAGMLYALGNGQPSKAAQASQAQDTSQVYPTESRHVSQAASTAQAIYPADALAHTARYGVAFALATLEQPQTTLPDAFRARVTQWLPQIKIQPLQGATA